MVIRHIFYIYSSFNNNIIPQSFHSVENCTLVCCFFLVLAVRHIFTFGCVVH